MTGATEKSDIWSVGCTVIELLKGSPPYSELPPMPALFRIVQDDHPPLPTMVRALVPSAPRGSPAPLSLTAWLHRKRAVRVRGSGERGTASCAQSAATRRLVSRLSIFDLI